MVNIMVRFGAYAYGNNVQYCLYVTITMNGENIRSRTTFAEELAYLMNKWGSKVKVNGYGWEADLPENVALAAWYLQHTTRPPQLKELDEIVETGTTRLHTFLEEAGFPAKPDPLGHVPNLFERGGYKVSIANFPTIKLSHNEEGIAVKFREGEVNTGFIRKLLGGEASEAEVEMLKGISLLKEKAQRKHLHALSTGKLFMVELAGAMFRSAVSSRDERQWKGVVKWLENHGYKKRANEIVVKKTLCS
jgi:hypothetical protein